MTARLAAVPDPADGAGGELDVLRSVPRADFLARAGWDPVALALAPACADALLGEKECAVTGCPATAMRGQAGLCRPCHRRWEASGQAREDFLAEPPPGRPSSDAACRVDGCPRPAKSAERLCATHTWQRQRHRGLDVEQWLARPEVRPLPSFGACVVASCASAAAHGNGLCAAHDDAWRDYRKEHPQAVLARWAACAVPARVGGTEVVLLGLPERVVAELLAGLQRRTDAGLRTLPTSIRYLVKLAHAHQVGSLLDLERVPAARIRSDGLRLLRSLTAELRAVLSSPEKERAKDIWQLRALGLAGSLDFTGISQRWLREAVKRWVAEDLPLHRGYDPAGPARDVVRAASVLSQCLRLSRDDGGNDPARLGRADITAYANRLAHLEHTGEMTASTRLRQARRVFRLLSDIQALGMTAAGEPAAGLPASFVLRPGDVPREADRPPQPRSLPATVLEVIAANLDAFEQRCGTSERRITELLIDTGRRPDEICVLPWDCLDRDATGPVLIYTDAKNNRPGRRLPISEDTATVIITQKDWVRQRYPLTPPGELSLFPRDKGNKDGAKPIRSDAYGNAHRFFADQIAGQLLDADGQQVNPALVVPYAYRHSYAQRHADAGVPPDVLRELMSHRTMHTTVGYYQIAGNRLRAAVDSAARHQFTGPGQRVLTGIAGLLASDHARSRAGEVAVPFGLCTEPSNVRSGGQACPCRYVCTGCGHFRSDPSYLPELKSYLRQLLAGRERLIAAALQPTGPGQATPADDQVSQVRDLIRQVEAGLEALSEQDQARIREAVTAIRDARQAVIPGTPAISPPGENR